MILQELADYYETFAKQGKMPRPGWASCNVSYALSISQDGELLDVLSLLNEKSPQRFVLPAPVIRRGVLPNFLCDNSGYILGVDSKNNVQRSKEYFEGSLTFYRNILANVDSLAAKAILCYFEKWKPEEAHAHPALVDCYNKILKGANIIFRINEKYAHEDSAICEAWDNYQSNKPQQNAIICLVAGKESVPVRLHPVIKGVRGPYEYQGAPLIAFEKSARAYSSYGYDEMQGLNAPVGEHTAFAYSTALNHLLNDREHTQYLGDTTVVFWAKGGQQAAQDIVAAFFSSDENEIKENDLKNAMTKLSKGLVAPWGAEELHPDTPFFILGLSPNAARISVRFFLRDSLGAFAGNMLQHHERLEIVKPVYDKKKHLSFYNLLWETVNQKSREKTPSSVMSGELIRAVLTGNPYPSTLLNGVTLRIRAEHEVTRGRAAIIKAYYLKKPHPDCPKEVLTVSLNESQNVPYRLGRAFALLESIQQAASPGLNATIKDKYFNSASAAPATIFPLLINLAQKHLRKIEGGLHVHLEKQLGEVLDFIEDFPARLTLPEQGAFQLGYYHQTQKRYEKKEDNTNA